MQSMQLNTGRIADFIPIGQDGQPIYLNAEAFRAALAINPMVGDVKVRHLAVPRMRADGASIDWYVPFPPQSPDGQYRVVTWQSATPEERTQALAQLHDFEMSLKRLGQDLMRRSGDRKSMLFARYLTGQNSAQNLPAIHFPSPEYVYIVDGIAVITFWGFCLKGANLSQSPFAPLRAPAAAAAPASAVGAAAVGAGAAASSAPLDNLSAGPEDAPVGRYTQERHHCIIPAWLLKLLAGILLFLLLLLLLWWLLPKFLGPIGWFGGSSSSDSVFDSALDKPVVAVPYDDAPAASGGFVPERAAGVSITHDHGILLDTIPDNVEEVQDVTNPDEVQALLEAPVVDTSEHKVQVTHEEPLAVVSEPLLTDDGTQPSVAASDDTLMLTEETVPGMTIGAGPSSNNVLDLGAGAAAPEGPTAAPEGPAAETEVAPEGVVAPVSEPAAPLSDSAGAADVSSEVAPVTEPAAPLSDSAGATNEASEVAPSAQQVVPPDPLAKVQEGHSVGSGGVVRPETLSFSSAALAQNGARVFNGAWQTRSGLMDSANGRPLQLTYEFRNGSGQAVVTRPDGTRCVTAVAASAAGSVLSVNAEGRALCPDSSTYQVPEVKCALNAQNQVECFGYYGDKRFPIQFYRN